MYVHVCMCVCLYVCVCHVFCMCVCECVCRYCGIYTFELIVIHNTCTHVHMYTCTHVHMSTASAATLLNIQNARKHFEKLEQFDSGLLGSMMGLNG